MKVDVHDCVGHIFFYPGRKRFFTFPKNDSLSFRFVFLTCFISDGTQLAAISFVFLCGQRRQDAIFHATTKLNRTNQNIYEIFCKNDLRHYCFRMRLLLIWCHYIVAHADPRCDFNLMDFNRNNEKTRK